MRWRDRSSLGRAAVGVAVALALLTAAIWSAHGRFPGLHGLDVDRRVIYVGTFSKTSFPALRLGFVIVPPDLRDRIIGARRSADIHPAALHQTVVADLMISNAFERHLRRMRTEYRRGSTRWPTPLGATVAASWSCVQSRPGCTLWPI